jgi:hypothetical protein
MSIQSIISFISNTKKSNNNELSVSNYFRGDMNEFNEIGFDYINILKNNFNNYKNNTDKSIYIHYNSLWFNIQYQIDNNEIYWSINIADNLNKF